MTLEGSPRRSVLLSGLAKCTVSELRSLAKRLELKGRSRLRKSPLVEALANVPGIGRLVPSVHSKRNTTSTSMSDRSEAESRDAAASFDSRAQSASMSQSERKSDPRSNARKEVNVRPEDARLGALAVHPRCTFVFWDVPAEQIDRAAHHVGDVSAQLVLRTFDVTGAGFDGTNSHAHSYFDVSVEGAKGSQYLELATPGRSIYCELGLRASDSRFQAVAWSNSLDLPVEQESGECRDKRAPANPPQTHHWRRRLPPQSEYETTEAVPPAAEAAVGTDGWGQRGAWTGVPAEVYPRKTGQHTSESTIVAPLGWTYSVGSLSSSEFALRSERSDVDVSTVGVSSGAVLPVSESVVDSVGEKLPHELSADLVVYGRGQPGTTVRFEGLSTPLASVPVGNDGTFELRVRLRDLDQLALAPSIDRVDQTVEESNGR